MNKASKPRVRQSTKLMIVRGLNACCTVVDAIVYRPFMVKLTAWSPLWWHCQLARLSIKLDDHWQTGFWDADDAPACPDKICDACKRRAAWLYVGGMDEDEDLEWDFEGKDVNYLYSSKHRINLCSHCHLDGSLSQNSSELTQQLKEARSQSVAWRWK